MKSHNFTPGLDWAGLLLLGMIGSLSAGEMALFQGDIDGSSFSRTISSPGANKP